MCSRIPLPNVPASSASPTGAYTSAGAKAPLQDDKAGFRVDADTRFGLLSNYYFVDKYSLVNPLQQAPLLAILGEALRACCSYSPSATPSPLALPG